MVTGVTNFLKIDEVRQEIDSAFPNPGEDAEGELVVENNGYGHRLIGNAFEFLCRLLLYRRCTEVIRPQSRTVLDFEREWSDGETPTVLVQRYDGMQWEDHENVSTREEWEEMNQNRPVWDRKQSAVKWTTDEALSKLAEQYIQTGMRTDAVVRAALINAGWRPSEKVSSWIDRKAFEEDVLEEMSDLFRLLRDQNWTTGETVMEKPKFGDYRYILPGEGDFIVDDLLVDIKTTEDRTFTDAFWRQLLLYYVLVDIQRELYEIDGGTYSKEPFDGKYPEITCVGIYFARFGELKTIDLETVLDDDEEYETFRAWIVDRAIEENSHTQYDYSDIRATLTDPYDFKKQRTLFDDY
jgi:hypothetical protein